MARTVDPSDAILDALLDVRTVFDPGSALTNTLMAALHDVSHDSAVAWVALPDPGNDLVIETVLGQRTDELGGLDVGVGQGLTGHVYSGARVHWVNEYAVAECITHEFDSIIEAERIRRMIAAPLNIDDQVLGVLTIGRRDVGEFGDTTIARVEALAHRASLALSIAKAARDSTAAAALAERRRISEELHDSVGALLFSLASRTDRLQRRIDLPEVAAEIELLRSDLGQVGSMVRSMVSEWHSSASGDLQAEVRGIVEDFELRSDIPAVPVFLGVLPQLSSAQMQAITRFVGVSLSNVERHSAAKQVSVTVAGLPGILTVSVCNDGPSPESVVPGVGLGGAEERIARLGGTLTRANDETGTGFTVRARIPV